MTQFVNHLVKVEWVLITLLTLGSSAVFSAGPVKFDDAEIMFLIMGWLAALSIILIIQFLALWVMYRAGRRAQEKYALDIADHKEVHRHLKLDYKEMFAANILAKEQLIESTVANKKHIDEQTEHIDEQLRALTILVSATDRRRSPEPPAPDREKLRT